MRRSALLDKQLLVGLGIDGDNNRTRDEREGETNPCSPSSPTVQARDFDLAATKTQGLRFVTFSDAIDSNIVKLSVDIMKDCQIQRTYTVDRISIRLFIH